jgi:hypothetical protein
MPILSNSIIKLNDNIYRLAEIARLFVRPCTIEQTVLTPYLTISQLFFMQSLI